MRTKLLLAVVALAAVWFALRPEMCTPTRPDAKGIGTTYQARFFGPPPSVGELLALEGPVVDLCTYDYVYKAEPICIAARALFSIGGPGVIWLCPCSMAANMMNGLGPGPQFDAWHQLTCEEA